MSDFTSILESLGGAGSGLAAGAVSSFFLIRAKVDEHEKRIEAMQHAHNEELKNMEARIESALNVCRGTCARSSETGTAHLTQRIESIERRFERIEEKLDRVLLSISK
jgi:predicted  nucleic acid-binding Zn-ribbon protein